jgi:hypothetical protein
MIMISHKLKLKLDNKEISFEIRIFKPLKDANTWYCRYEIDWPDEDMHIMRAAGYDALQSLVNALNMIGAEIYATNYHKDGQLRAYETEQGYGFPVGNSIRHLLVGMDAKYL